MFLLWCAPSCHCLALHTNIDLEASTHPARREQARAGPPCAQPSRSIQYASHIFVEGIWTQKSSLLEASVHQLLQQAAVPAGTASLKPCKHACLGTCARNCDTELDKASDLVRRGSLQHRVLYESAVICPSVSIRDLARWHLDVLKWTCNSLLQRFSTM